VAIGGDRSGHASAAASTVVSNVTSRIRKGASVGRAAPGVNATRTMRAPSASP
jgi:hypothetical protein